MIAEEKCLKKTQMNFFIVTMHNYGMMTLLEEFEPYVAFQSQQPYDNAVGMKWFNTVLTCSRTVFPRLYKHHASQSSTNPLRLMLMSPLLAHCDLITPIICEYIRLHGALTVSVVLNCNSTVAHREKPC